MGKSKRTESQPRRTIFAQILGVSHASHLYVAHVTGGTMPGVTMGSVVAAMIAHFTKPITLPIATSFLNSSPTKRPTRVVESLHIVICRGAQAREFKAEHGGR